MLRLTSRTTARFMSLLLIIFVCISLLPVHSTSAQDGGLTPQVVKTLDIVQRFRGRPYSLKWSGDKIVVSASDGIRVFTPSDKLTTVKFFEAPQAVSEADTFLSGDTVGLLINQDYSAVPTLFRWKISSGESLPPIVFAVMSEKDRGRAIMYATNPDGSLIVDRTTPDALRVWNFSSGKQIGSIKLPAEMQNGVPTVGISPDGNTAIIVVKQMTYALDVATGNTLWKRDTGSRTDEVRFADDGNSVYVGGGFEDFLVLDAKTGKPQRRLRVKLGPHFPIKTLMPTPDGADLLIVADFAGAEQGIRVLDAVSGKTKRLLGGFDPLDATISPDGKQVAAIHGNKLVIMDYATGEVSASYEFGRTFQSAFISGDRQTFGLVGRDGAALYDASKLGNSGSDTPFAIFDDPTGNEFNATLSADGTKLAVGVFYIRPSGWDSKLLLYDVPTKTLVKTITYGVVTSFATSPALGQIQFLPDGNRLMAVNRGLIELIDTTSLKDAKKLFTLPTKGPDIMSLEVSPDGTMIGTIEGSYRARTIPKTAYLYDTKFGKKLHTMLHKELAENSYQITFSSDSKQAVIRTIFGEMDLWNVESGKLEKTVIAPERGTYIYWWLTLDQNIAILPVRRFDAGYKPEVPSEVAFVNLNTGNRLKILPLALSEQTAEFAFVAGNKVIIASRSVGLVWVLAPKP